ncbi:MAG: carbamoyltransferase HypF [bacterium]
MSSQSSRLRVEARGAVQGVGFRPFVHRIATDLGLHGWVRNTPAGADLEVEGSIPALDAFLVRLRSEKPVLAVYHGLEHSILEPAGLAGFEILESDACAAAGAVILPDIATCADCLREIFDPADRRFRYPFTNCTNCGPRFSIVTSLPWDRPRTTMCAFPLCGDCDREYHDSRNRRFHAQPVACPVCGPQLTLLDGDGVTLATRADGLARTAAIIRDGRIVALKGLGGFHLICDARNEDAVRRLRKRKNREAKPFAVMSPSMDVARELCELSSIEEALLGSPEAPIVLGRSRVGGVCRAVAPGNPRLGVMLPYTPLHHLLLCDLGFPVVATSGNLSDEPVCYENDEAVERLSGIADAFLLHDRPIARPVEDSVAQVMAGRATMLRRSRGYAPMPVIARGALRPLLAAGAHKKNAVAIVTPGGVVLGAHLGDLETVAARSALDRAAKDLRSLYDVAPEAVACDAHPDYASTLWARSTGLPVVTVQHHVAHILACLAENDEVPPVLGIAWDGAGFGPDGTIWGGEFLHVRSPKAWERVAAFRRFRLSGGDRAAREPRRAALGLAFEVFGDDIPARIASMFSDGDLRTLLAALRAGVNAPFTSSAGRLFDAFAAICGLRATASFEGQAAMDLEFAAERDDTDASYSIPLDDDALDWAPMLRAVLADLDAGVTIPHVAASCHNALAAAAVSVARRTGLGRVALSGGCFQNAVLTTAVVTSLESAGFTVIRHQRVPSNDGGIALGQAIAAGS